MEANREIRSDVDDKFFVQYQNIYVGEPMVIEDSHNINSTVGHFVLVLIGRLLPWNAESVV